MMFTSVPLLLSLILVTLRLARPVNGFVGPCSADCPVQRVGGSRMALHAAIQSGDTVLVVGGTGGVGQLVTKKLQAPGMDCQVRVTSRNKERGEETIDDETVEVVELDLVSGELANVKTALEGVAGMVISVGTTAFPTAKWAGGNTPDAIDHLAVARLAQAAQECATLKKVVLVTSVGVDRTGDMPFVILNLFGVLDAKKQGEAAVKRAATAGGFDYVIVRPGRLVGGPFTNLDVARLLQIEGGAENGVECAPGDQLLGDCKRDACAEAIVQALRVDSAQNLEFSIVSDEEKKALLESEWETVFEGLKQ